MVDTGDLKSLEDQTSCGFKSRPRHQNWIVEIGVWKKMVALRAVHFFIFYFLPSNFWRPRPESNRGMAVLQTAALTTWLRGRYEFLIW